MSNEIRAVASSGTLYARIMNPSGLIWNTSSEEFEAYSAPNYSSYDIALTEQGNSNVYVVDFPTAIIVAGVYEYFVHRQAGGSPAEGDMIINTGKINWTGTSAQEGSTTTGAMNGVDWRSYILGPCGFKRTDKDTEIYAATTDAIQELRRRMSFDEAEKDITTTDTISVDGDFKITCESDFGLVIGLTLQDGNDAFRLIQVSKQEFDSLYPDNNITNDRGFPKHYCIYAGNIEIGPVPDRTTYTYRITYSMRGLTITSETTSVPFTNVYRDILAENVLMRLYRGLQDHQEAVIHEGAFEKGIEQAFRRESRNSGNNSFVMVPTNV